VDRLAVLDARGARAPRRDGQVVGRLRRRLTALGVPDLHVELFDAGHGEIEYRYPLGLRYLVERLS
jgi:hypothetical protein